jgi:hypothetical protein
MKNKLPVEEMSLLNAFYETADLVSTTKRNISRKEIYISIKL